MFNRIPDLSLPDGVTPSVSPLFSPSGLIYRYVLQSPDRTPMELKTIDDWIIQRQYKSVQGVADDSGLGGETMQYQVLLDPVKIAAVGLSVAQVESALTANNGNAGGGFYSQGGQFYYVRGLGRLETLEDIGDVVLAVRDGTPILVKDVAQVVIGYAPRLGQFGYQDQDDAVEGVILMRTGEQTQKVLKQVEAKTKELNEKVLPKDVKILPYYDRSELVALTTETVERNLLRGMLLVVVVLVFFLYDFRCRIDCGHGHPAVVAVRVHLSEHPERLGQPAVHRRGGFRDPGGRRGGDGGKHFPPGRRAARGVVQNPGSHRRGGRGSGSADRLRRRRDRGGLSADLRPVRTFRQIVPADGGHDDFCAGRLVDYHADPAAGALFLGHAERRARAAQSRL